MQVVYADHIDAFRGEFVEGPLIEPPSCIAECLLTHRSCGMSLTMEIRFGSWRSPPDPALCIR